MPADIADWLADRGSLTRRLRTHGRFHVTPLYQGFATPTAVEARMLGLPSRRQALIREVTLHLEGTAVIYARSVLPLSTLRGANRVLGHMARRALGDELFRPPRADRHVIWASRFPAGVLPVAGLRGEVWGRQSLFLKRGQPLLVAEMFLPTLWPLTGE